MPCFFLLSGCKGAGGRSSVKNLSREEKREYFEQQLFGAVSSCDGEKLGQLRRQWARERELSPSSGTLSSQELYHYAAVIKCAAAQGGLALDALAGLWSSWQNSMAQGGEARREVLLWEMAAQATEELKRQKKYMPKNKMEQVEGYIKNHLSDSLSLTSIAKEVGLNSSYLSRRYKEYYGVGLAQSIHQQRVALAKEKFEQGETSVIHVAQMVGFNDSNHFSKIFKKITGVTPRDYIKKQNNRQQQI